MKKIKIHIINPSLARKIGRYVITDLRTAATMIENNQAVYMDQPPKSKPAAQPSLSPSAVIPSFQVDVEESLAENSFSESPPVIEPVTKPEIKPSEKPKPIEILGETSPAPPRMGYPEMPGKNVQDSPLLQVGPASEPTEESETKKDLEKYEEKSDAANCAVQDS